jgi:hypothetical protein
MNKSQHWTYIVHLSNLWLITLSCIIIYLNVTSILALCSVIGCYALFIHWWVWRVHRDSFQIIFRSSSFSFGLFNDFFSPDVIQSVFTQLFISGWIIYFSPWDVSIWVVVYYIYLSETILSWLNAKLPQLLPLGYSPVLDNSQTYLAVIFCNEYVNLVTVTVLS